MNRDVVVFYVLTVILYVIAGAVMYVSRPYDISKLFSETSIPFVLLVLYVSFFTVFALWLWLLFRTEKKEG